MARSTELKNNQTSNSKTIILQQIEIGILFVCSDNFKGYHSCRVNFILSFIISE